MFTRLKQMEMLVERESLGICIGVINLQTDSLVEGIKKKIQEWRAVYAGDLN